MKTFVLYRIIGDSELFAISIDGIAVNLPKTFDKVFPDLGWAGIKVDRTWVSSSVVPDIPIWRHIKKADAVSYLD